MVNTIQFTCASILSWPLFTLLQGTGWVLAAAGLGRLHHKCNSYYETSNECGDSFSSEWCTLFFQLLVLLIVWASGLSGALTRVRTAVSIFMTMASVRLMYDAEAAISGVVRKYSTSHEADIFVGPPDANSDYSTRLSQHGVKYLALGDGIGEVEYDIYAKKSLLRAYLAGLLMLILVNLVFLWIIGSDWQPNMGLFWAWIEKVLSQDPHQRQQGTGAAEKQWDASAQTQYPQIPQQAGTSVQPPQHPVQHIPRTDAQPFEISSVHAASTNYAPSAPVYHAQQFAERVAVEHQLNC